MGDRGVDIFFVLSGFLIGCMLIKEQKSGTINLKRFFIRRWLRLTPTYYFMLAIFAIGVSLNNIESVNLSYLWANVFYVDNFLDMENRHIGYSWSLAVEEQFYIIFALLMYCVVARLKNPMILYVFLFLLSFVIRYIVIALHPQLVITADLLIATDPKAHNHDFFELTYGNLHTRYGALVCGIIIAHLHVNNASILKALSHPAIGNIALLVAFLLAFGSTAIPVYNLNNHNETLLIAYHTVHRNIFAMGIAGLIAVCLNAGGVTKIVRWLLARSFWFPITQLTYSLYLVHLPILIGIYMYGVHKGLFYSVDFANMCLLLLVAFIPITIMAALVFIFLEKPFMNMRDLI